MNIATATEKTRIILTSLMRRACASFAVDVSVDVLVELEVLEDEVEAASVEELVLEVVGLELVELEDPESEVAELEALGLELLTEPLLVDPDPPLGVPRIPPWTLAGTELTPVPAAASLYASRVFRPPEGGLITATIPA
jgi:hypothetical protein